MANLLASLPRAVVAAGFLTLCGATFSHAQSAQPPKKEISDDVSAAFGKLRELTDAKNFTAALAQLDGLLQTAPADSFDRAIIAQIKSQILLAEGKYAAAIEPLGIALELGERHGFFETSMLQEMRYMLAQVHCQVASDGGSVEQQREHYDRAQGLIARWFADNKRPKADAHMLAASLLYNRATLVNGQPDLERLRQVVAEANKGLAMQAKPNLQFYVLILAAQQQLGDTVASADTLELLVKHQPDSATYWQQLAASYISLAGDAKNEDEAHRLYLRAILTLERAQQQGFLNTPKDHQNLTSIYFNIRRFDRAAELLEKGLADGTVENTRRNWELLASAYQQQRQDERAIATYQRAIQKLPQDGQCELALAQIFYGLGRTREAYERIAAGLAKGGVDKPGQSKLFIAYLACELHRYEDAARWIVEAGRHDDVKPGDLARLDRAVRDALKERAELREAKL